VVSNEVRSTPLGNTTLLEIIRVQSDIARLGLELGGVMSFVAPPPTVCDPRTALNVRSSRSAKSFGMRRKM